MKTKFLITLIVISFITFSCKEDKKNKKGEATIKTSKIKAPAKTIAGAVYIASNNTPNNTLVGFKQFSDGSLEKMGEYKTGGKGTGNVELFDVPYDPTGLNTFADGIDPLASAYGVWRTPDHKHVLSVNAGNGTVSSLKVMPDMSLRLNNVVAAGNVKPETIATHKNFVYVASLGRIDTPTNDGTLMGFTINENGILKPMEGTKRDLTGRPVSLQFTPDGKFLAMVEITTGMINIYAVDANGMVSKGPVSRIASPISKDRFFALPIGTVVKQVADGYQLFVTETRFVTAKGEFHNASEEEKKKYPFLPVYSGQTGSVSSYKINPDGKISIISADVMAGKEMWGGQQATCWAAMAPDGKRFWADSPLTSSLNAYNINDDGSIELTDEIAYQDDEYNEYFLDMDLSGDQQYINVVSGNTGRVLVFKYNNNDNKLEKIGEYDGGEKIHTYGLVSIRK